MSSIVIFLRTIFLCGAMCACVPASSNVAAEIKAQGQFVLTEPARSAYPGRSVSRHGHLQVRDGQIVGQDNRPASLAGPSFFWSNTDWGMARFYNQEAVRHFAETWRAGIVRAAIAGEHDGSYLDQPEANYARAQAIIEGAVASDIYVIVDWHTHHAEDHMVEAEVFFKRLATEYGHLPNLIYEIYNEPLGATDWSGTVKPYAERIIRAIRAIDPDNLIIVGTQSWSQDVDKAARDPIIGFENIGYALHFYAGTHGRSYRKKAERAIDLGLPIMITEWGSVDHTGDGAVDRASTRAWLDFIRRHQLTHLIWSVSDKEEGAAMLRPGASSEGGWTDEDLTASGRLARDIIANWTGD